MARYITTVPTSLSPAEAFAKVGDLSNFEEWDPGVRSSVQVKGDGPAVGSAYDVSVKTFTGGSMTLTYEVTEFVPDHRLVAVAETSALRSFDIITVAQAEDGSTTLTYDAELSLKGLFRPGNTFLGLVFDQIGDKADAGLRAYLR